MKIGQYLAKIWTRVQCATFFETRCSLCIIGLKTFSVINWMSKINDNWLFWQYFASHFCKKKKIIWLCYRSYSSGIFVYLIQILIRTMKRSAPDVLRFLTCTFVFFFGFAICGWVVLGPYHIKVSSLCCTVIAVHGWCMRLGVASLRSTSRKNEFQCMIISCWHQCFDAAGWTSLLQLSCGCGSAWTNCRHRLLKQELTLLYTTSV